MKYLNKSNYVSKEINNTKLRIAHMIVLERIS